MFVFLIAYVERTQLIRAKVPILRFKEKGRWEQKSRWCLFLVLFCFYNIKKSQKEAVIQLLPFLLFSVIWSLISMSTTQWASETHSCWEVMPMVSEDDTGYVRQQISSLVHVFGNVSLFSPALLTSLFPADLRIRPMIHVVKKWARHNQINDASKGTLSSYTLVLMVLHYLQSQYNHTQPRSGFLPSAALTYCQSHLVHVVFSTALKEPVLPSLQRDYPVSLHIFFPSLFLERCDCITLMLLNPITKTNKVCDILRHNLVSGLCPFVLCPHFQECFSTSMDIDSVPEGPKRIPPYISRNQSSLGELFLGFLAYYATNFRYLPPDITLQSLVFQIAPMVLLPAHFLAPIPYLLLLWPTSSPSPVLCFSSTHSVLHPLLWFHISGWRTWTGGTFGLTRHRYGVPRSLCLQCVLAWQATIAKLK